MKKTGWAALIAMMSAPFAAQAEWLQANTAHFVIYGDTSMTKIHDLADRLNRYDAALRMMTNTPTDTDGPPLHIYLVSGLDAVHSLAKSYEIAGFYKPRFEEPMAIVPLDTGEVFGGSEVLYHEYAHHILLSAAADYYPSWLSEGLAEFFMTARFQRDGSIILGAPDESRGYWIVNNRTSARELLSTDDRKLDDRQMTEKYARGWVLVHYLLLGKTRQGQFDRYVQLVTHGVSSIKAGEQAFGDLNKLDAELDAYSKHRGSIPVFTVPIEQQKIGTIDIKRMSAGQGAMMPYRIRSTNGVDQKSAPTLVPEARRVAAQYPDDPAVLRALIEIEYDAGNDAQAEQAAQRAIQIDPKMVDAYVYLGDIQARRTLASAPLDHARWAEVRRWYLKANRIDPNNALALTRYYDSFLAAHEAPPPAAVNAVLRAIVLVPQDPRLHIRVARQMLREGNIADARQAIAPLAFNPHGGATNIWIPILKQLDDGASAPELLAAINKGMTAKAD